VIGKPERTGGRVDRQTVIEQMLYEVHDPVAYLAPDVVLDVSDVTVEEIAANRILEGGVNSSLGLGGHGKSLSFLVLDAHIELEGGEAAARCARLRGLYRHSTFLIS
jgi:hypothetical protein